MNTSTKGIMVLQCTECPNTFEMVGSVPIGLAFPRKPHICHDGYICHGIEQIHPHPAYGTCPAHRRKLSNAD